jgi:serine/threonine-protein kinase
MNVGDRIDGRYRLERLLGEGGMAAVYLALDERLERPVAIKLLWGGPRMTHVIAESFLREARIAASIRHPNVVQVLDFGKHSDPRGKASDVAAPYMVMEALDGEAMADRYSRGYRFQTAEVVSIALGCLEGLAAVHGAGIVHRDLKPENIFLARTGAAGTEVPKLLDFGISRAADKSSGLRSAVTTREGRLIGTPEYMSPEQARGVSDIDLRTDLYSLGVVMYEALWGRPPFESENDGDLMVLVMAGNAAALDQRTTLIPGALSEVVERAMSRDREGRFVSALEMHAALRAAWDAARAAGPVPTLPLTTGQSSAHEPHIEATLNELRPSVQRTPRSATVVGGRERRAILGATVAASAVIGTALAWMLLVGGPSEKTASTRYIVVQGNQTRATQGGGVAESPPHAVPAIDAAPDSGPKVELPAVPVRVGPKVKPTPADPGRALARAFERQKAPVVQCLSARADGLPAEAELAVRIALDEHGAVKSATVSPDVLAQTAAGKCIAQATLAMQFGAQASPVTFRVPLTARRN